MGHGVIASIPITDVLDKSAQILIGEFIDPMRIPFGTKCFRSLDHLLN
jgi:hypothetical protein